MSTKKYRLLAEDGSTYESPLPGQLGGNSKARIYGQFTCSAANAALAKGYALHRVFFADEESAIAAGYRPCGRCMRQRYVEWLRGGIAGSHDYPWVILPQK